MKLLSEYHNAEIFTYGIDKNLCSELMEIYSITARQLFRLAEAWDKFALGYRNKKTSGQN